MAAHRFFYFYFFTAYILGLVCRCIVGRRGDACCDCMLFGSGVCGAVGTLSIVEGLVFWESGSSAWSCGGSSSATGRMWQRFLLYIFPLDWTT